MTPLVLALWPALAGALALGLCAGWLAGPPRGWAAPLGLAAAALALAALAGLAPVPAEAGPWIESAALMLPAYLAGCVLGALAARRG